MLFHEPDRTFKRLAGCWKRSQRYAKPGEINLNHPLAIAWMNCKLFLEAKDNEEIPYFGFSLEDIAEIENEKMQSYLVDLICLDWFARKVEEYAKTHMLDQDEDLPAILNEWLSHMFVDPTKLV